jgi:hypothetical protein
MVDARSGEHHRHEHRQLHRASRITEDDRSVDGDRVLMRCLIAVACVVLAAVVGSAQSPSRELHICHAGSLSAAFADVEKAFTAQQPKVAIDDVSGGSVTLARRLATGAQACDVYASADYLDIDLMLKPAGLAEYTVRFGTAAWCWRTWRPIPTLKTSPSTTGLKSCSHPACASPAHIRSWIRAGIART